NAWSAQRWVSLGGRALGWRGRRAAARWWKQIEGRSDPIPRAGRCGTPVPHQTDATRRALSTGRAATKGLPEPDRDAPLRSTFMLNSERSPITGKRVQLMATCLCDAFYDDVAAATVEVLE